MRPSSLLFFIILLLFSFGECMAQVTGRVTDAGRKPLPGVHVINKGSGSGTQTDGQGTYAINADPRDTLLFSFVGMQPVEIHVERSPSVINVSMQAADIRLEEVEVSADRERSLKTQKELLAEYPENKNLVKTFMGILDRDISSNAFRMVDGDDLAQGGRDFFDALQAWVPQMRVVRESMDDPEVKVYLRQYAGTPSTALFDVDGNISNFPPTYLSAHEIDRIAVMERNAAMIRYGPQGAPGVIVINTRAQTEMDERGLIRTYDNREFEKSLKKAASYLDPYRPFEPSYLAELKEAKTRKEALAIYESQREGHLSDPYYFLDLYDLFLSRWGRNNISEDLFQELRSQLSGEVPALKALAYLEQHYGNYESALDLYIQILMQGSWEAQALRDVANAYAETGDVKKAWMYYSQYIDIQNQVPDSHFDAEGKDLLITTEMMGIIDLKKEPFLDQMEMDNILDADMRTRLVFEWNRQDADFELQFVTPEDYYDTWEHRPDGAKMQDEEAVSGYCSKQFFLGKENTGLWQVNIDYRGGLSEPPTYLKASVYRDFGLEGQTLEVKVFRLSGHQKKGQLFTLQQN